MRQHLADRVRRFMDTSLVGPPSEPFERLALALFRWQRAHAPVVEALVEGNVDAWWQIPAVPVGLFKDLPVGTVAEGEPAVVFRTSGTTGGGRGEHRVRDTALYDHGSLAWARHCVPHMPSRVVSLLADPTSSPDSSLSHMVALFGRATWHVPDGTLDRAGLDAAVRGADQPLFVASTAFALAEWLDRATPRLPEGSVLMVTGGFKGRVHRLDGDALYAAADQALAPARIVTEYGMTELSSQLWGSPTTPYAPPPWLWVVAVDPATGLPLPAGEVGQLRFYDLANLDSSIGIETLDAGVVQANGRVVLQGRLAGAAARGCSLTVEEAWARRP